MTRVRRTGGVIGGLRPPRGPRVRRGSGALGLVGGLGGASPMPPIQVGGVTPNYAELIRSSPEYVAWLASATARRSNLATQRAGGLRSLLQRHGGIPKNFTDVYGDLSPADIEAANSNQFSDEAQIAKNYQMGVNAMHGSLAARGMLQGGELNYGQEQQDAAKSNAEYQSNSAFMDAVNQLLSGYASGMGDISGEEAGVVSSAEQNVEGLYPPTPAHDASLSQNLSLQYGQPIYVDADGAMWTAAGESFTPPASTAAQHIVRGPHRPHIPRTHHHSVINQIRGHFA